MTSPHRPLIVRLRNWVGDVVLGVPMLQRLHDEGYALQLIGKRWAVDLLAGCGWPVHVLPKSLGERVRQLRGLARLARQADPAFDRRINAIALPYSFSSALEMRLAGLRAIGHAHEGRSLLLSHAVPHPRQDARTRQQHELEIYWHLGSALLQQPKALPQQIALPISARHQEQALALQAEHRLRPGYIVICPFAGGTFAGQDKTWPEFAAFVSEDMPKWQHDVVVCPGPGEEEQATRAFAAARCLPGVDLGTYAALLKSAALMVSNDTGPGHLAAAVGTPLLSVLGPSDPSQWRAWGPTVQLVQGAGSWPTRQAVAERAHAMLSGLG